MKKKQNRKMVEYAKAIQNTIKESPERELIDSPESLMAFLKKEKLYKSKIRDRIKIIEKLAKDLVDGKRDIKIDLDKIPTTTTPGKLEATQLLSSLERQISTIGPDATYDKTYQVVSKLAILIQLLFTIATLLANGPTDDKQKSKKKQFVQTVKKIDDPNKKTPNEILSWVKSIVSLIKK